MKRFELILFAVVALFFQIACNGHDQTNSINSQPSSSKKKMNDTTKSNRQDFAYKHALPYMWSSDGYKYDTIFRANKRDYLNTSTVIQPTALYLGNFLGMIEYFENGYGKPFNFLRVYIAISSSTGQLTLIFSPVGTLTDFSKDFFIIPDPNKPFDPDNINEFMIGKSTAEAWEKNYTDKMPNLRGTYNEGDSENQMKDGTPSDTRCITYCREALEQLLNEQGKYIHTDPSNTRTIEFSTDMLANFAAFNEHGNPRNGKGAKRLFVQFDFLNDSGSPIDLERDTYLGPKGIRDESSNPCPLNSIFYSKNNVTSNDNGTLCPPCVNCPPGTPGCDNPIKSH